MEFYFPLVTEAFSQIRAKKIFSKIDLQKGFYQVEIKESDKQKTAFTCPFGKYEFNRLPFGLKNAPKFFNNEISKILRRFNNVIVFIDDILVYDGTLDEHIYSLRQIFRKLSEYNIIVNFEKSEFLTDNIKYLGFIIDHESYRTDLSRLKNFTKWKHPTTRRQLQRLLGKINWYVAFLLNLSGRISHLSDHLKGKAKKINLTDEDMNAVNEIYKELTENAKNYLPDPNSPCDIFVDDSDRGMGAVLSQNKQSIAYCSKKFNDAGLKYSVTEKEACAALKSVIKWQSMICGFKIILHTDSKNNLGKDVDYSKRTDRWKALLSEFDIDYTFIKGVDNIAADALSRMEENNICSINFETDQCFRNLKNFHIQNGHPGITKTKKTFKMNDTLDKNIKKLIIEQISSCNLCQKFKRHKFKYGNPTGAIKTTVSFQDISSDIFGPFNSCFYENSFNNAKI